MGLSFDVSKDVLIPRQDTEVLVQEILKAAEGKDVLDMCTGSGCIIISLAKLGRIHRGIGVDISIEALSIARKNAKKLQADVSFIHSNLFDQVEGQFDIIVSNPPYIPTSDINDLMEEVKNHEPIIALDGEEDGLHFYRTIVNQLSSYLKPSGYVFFEIGYNQGETVSRILEEHGFRNIKVIKDLAGLDRVVSGQSCNVMNGGTVNV
jgi:release factor glutamine methyltransferase